MEKYSREGDPAYFALRDSLVVPIPEIEVAASLLDDAADAILSNESSLAQQLIKKADQETLRTYALSIVGKKAPEIRRLRIISDAPPHNRTTKMRMPNRNAKLAIFERDGWRCRFCGIRVISLEAVKIMNDIFPDTVRWSARPFKLRNSAFNVLASSLDHLVPHSRGGNNDPSNLVTACGSCQFGRKHYILEEVGLNDPRSRPPVVDKWDGLTRLLALSPGSVAHSLRQLTLPFPRTD